MPELFDGVHEFPDGEWLQRYEALEGLDAAKDALMAEAMLATAPANFQAWAKKLRGGGQAVLSMMADRPHMVILHGEVGTGKTEIAESIGAAAAARLRKDFVLKRLSLSVRGRGHVGEMTALLTAAFQKVVEEAKPWRRDNGASKGMVLVIDEADSLAQSREGEMHHEDRAGVNALLRGLDDIARERLPVLTILCTNRRSALDPAIRRRATLEWEFHRPGVVEIESVIGTVCTELGIPATGIREWANHLTGLSGVGVTYSDLRKRILPAIVLDAWMRGTPDLTRLMARSDEIGASPRFGS